MTNHPNRGWRARWRVDLATSTATHQDGWQFRFAVATDDTSALDGECVGQPSPITPAHLANAARIAREAGEIYIEARRDRH